MVKPVIGSVILLPFPFSDLSASKLRPALLVASLPCDRVFHLKVGGKYANIHE